MIVRAAEADDLEHLKTFKCSDGTSHQNGVERWIQRKAAGWVRSHPANHEIRVLVNDAGELRALCGFEPGQDETSWFIPFFAVSSDCQGDGLATRLLETCLDELAVRSPGGYAYWKVHEGNGASQTVSQRVGAEADSHAPGARVRVYYIGL